MSGKLVLQIRPGHKDVGHVWYPKLLKERSIRLRNILIKAGACQVVTLEFDEAKTSVDALLYVIDQLQNDIADAGGKTCDAEWLAKVCTILIEYQCDPRPFEALWDKVWPPSSSESFQSRPGTILSPKSHSNVGSQNTRTSSSDGDPAVRCWRRELEDHAETTAGQLAIAAFALGKKEAFRRELGTAVWALDTDFDLTIIGLADVQATRRKEKKAIFQTLQNKLLEMCVDGDKQTAETIFSTLRTSGPGQPTGRWEVRCQTNPMLLDWDPYKLVREYEKALGLQPPSLPLPRPSSSNALSKQQSPNKDHRAPPSFIGTWVEKGKKKLSSTAGADKTAAAMKEVFDEIEKGLLKSQVRRADILFQGRVADVTAWFPELRGIWPSGQALSGPVMTNGHSFNPMANGHLSNSLDKGKGKAPIPTQAPQPANQTRDENDQDRFSGFIFGTGENSSTSGQEVARRRAERARRNGEGSSNDGHRNGMAEFSYLKPYH